ncbi:MAG: hypothetical protein WAO83_25340 [Fuerstiella sp.]
MSDFLSFPHRFSSHKSTAGLWRTVLIPVAICLAFAASIATSNTKRTGETQFACINVVSTSANVVTNDGDDLVSTAAKRNCRNTETANRDCVIEHALPVSIRNSPTSVTESGVNTSRVSPVVVGRVLNEQFSAQPLLWRLLPRHAFGPHSAAVCGSPTLYQLNVLRRT